MANLSNINGKFVVEQTTGYVGVGTTDPNYPIEVLNASAEIALNASGGSIYRVQSDSASNFIIRKEGVGDRLVINSAGNSTFAGNVYATGISNSFVVISRDNMFVDAGQFYLGADDGTTDDSYRMYATSGQFVLASRKSGTWTTRFDIDTSGNATFQESIIFNNGAPFQAAASIRQQSDILILTGGGNGFAFNDDTNAVSNMLIDSGGNVGIGKSQSGNAVLTAKSSAGGNTGIILIEGDTTDDGWGVYATTANKYIITRFTGGSYSDKFIILEDGNVGIGTSSPYAQLHVSHSLGNGGIMLGNTATTGSKEMLLNIHPLGLIWQRWVNGAYQANLMTLDYDGNLGIGTTTVQNKFVVRDIGSGFNSTIQTSTVSIISKEMTDNAYHSILQLVAVRQSLTTGFNSQGYLGFSTVDDSNNQGQLDAGRIAIVNEAGSSRNSATALSFWTNPGGTQWTQAVEKFRISSGGYLKSLPTYGLTTATAANMHIDSNGTFYRSTSSSKYKTDVRDYDKGLNEVMQLQPKYYKGKNDGDTIFAGLIAEDVHALGLTEFVQYADDESPDALSYSHMVALLIKSIQELKADNDSLKARIETLEDK